jgi:hypothetical protein
MATPPPALELTDDGPSLAARVKFEVRCVRIILRQLEHLPIADLGTIPLYRRAQVDVVHLVALLGEGVLALDCLAFLLASDAEADDADAQSAASWARERAEELVDALWRLQEFRTSMWLLLNVLQRSVLRPPPRHRPSALAANRGQHLVPMLRVSQTALPVFAPLSPASWMETARLQSGCGIRTSTLCTSETRCS